MAYDILIGPVCDRHHWTLVVMYPKEKRALYLDPLGETPGKIKKCQDVTRSFMRHKNLHFSRWACSTVDHPRQPDATSCGAFVCKFAQLLLRGEMLHFRTDQVAVTQLRREIACTLVTDSEDLENLCRLCGNECQSPGREDVEKRDDWVRIDRLFMHRNV
ncbi:sentrin-specific protease 2-like [Alosa pseudoharengus]|uniref:sentrin-specific protease 2-like n=1 Tax=Alosa pseudoharengus TaxID=34774 RepID=UPI003F8B449C